MRKKEITDKLAELENRETCVKFQDSCKNANCINGKGYIQNNGDLKPCLNYQNDIGLWRSEYNPLAIK